VKEDFEIHEKDVAKEPRRRVVRDKRRRRQAPRKPPPAKFNFELALRADGRVNITFRLARLKLALSERSGFASMSVERMARELNAKPAAVRQARQKLVAMGYFERKGWLYHRKKGQEDEEPRAIWERTRRDSRHDLAARVIFFLLDKTLKTGQCEVSLAEIAEALGADRSHVARALKGVRTLGYFTVVPGEHSNVYNRTWDRYDPTEDMENHDDDAEQHGENSFINQRGENPYAYLNENGRRGRRKLAHAD
jgi:Mn-dependent DtxR family transcriptional regulator